MTASAWTGLAYWAGVFVAWIVFAYHFVGRTFLEFVNMGSWESTGLGFCLAVFWPVAVPFIAIHWVIRTTTRGRTNHE